MHPLRGTAKVEGTDIVLTFDVNAFCLAEMALGRTTDEIVEDFEAMRVAAATKARGSANFPLMRGLFWAGLQKHRDCTIDEAAEIMSDLDLGAVRDALAAGMLAAFGAAEDGDKKDPPKRKAKAGTG
jgi:hypothetical protein